MFAILQVTLRSLKFKLALVTSENTQVNIYETLSPGICLTRASVTWALTDRPILWHSSVQYKMNLRWVD